MSYAILRFKKYLGGSAKGIQAHNERQKPIYHSNPDIDLSRTQNNFHIVKPEKTYTKEINERIETHGCRTRRDSIRFVETLITASHEFFNNKTPAEVQEFFHVATEFMKEEIGEGNIFSAVVVNPQYCTQK